MAAFLLRAMRRLVALCLLSVAMPLGARPYSVDDMLRTEGFGRIEVAPGGRWLVFERQIPFATAARFDLDAIEVLRARLYIVDLAHPAAARPLLPQENGAGIVMLGFSPHGTRLAIGRLDGQRWTLGIVALDTGSVRWFAVAPDYSDFRPTLAWASDDTLIMLAGDGDTPPWGLRRDAQDRTAVSRAWAQAEEGQVPTVTAIGSGRFDGITALAPPVRLLRLDRVTGSVQILARGAFETLRLSPDGQHVALTEPSETIRVTTTSPIRQSADLRRRRLRIVDMTDGHIWTPCAACDLPFDPPLWSPDGRSLLFYARHGDRNWSTGQPWVADVRLQQARPVPLGGVQPEVIMTRGAYDAVALGWLGSTPIIFGRTDAGVTRADWYTLGQRGSAVLTSAIASPSSKLAPAPGSAPIMLTADSGWRLGRRRAQSVLSGMDGVMALATDAAKRNADAALLGWRRTTDGILIDLPTRHARQFEVRTAGVARPVAASLQTNVAIVTETLPNGVGHLLVVAADRPPLAVATINAGLAAVSVRPPLPVHHQLPDGRTVTSWLYLPTPAPSGRRPPLIVIPYAGTVYGDTAPALWNPGIGRTYTNVPALVGHGYAVLLPSMPDLAASDTAPFDFAGQILAAVDAVIAHGDADPARLGLWGHSYGGYTGAMVATQTGRFNAIIVSSGIYDLTSFQGTLAPTARMNPGYGLGILPWAGWTETGQPHLDASPWTNPKRYVANSPIYHVGRITTPMLILASDRDFTPLQQGEQLFSALYRQGKDAELISYWGENHVLMSPANVRDAYARVFAWFDSHFEAPRRPDP